MQTIACNAAPGNGGLGRHFAQVVEDARRDGRLARYYSPAVDRDGDLGEVVGLRAFEPLSRFTPLRFNAGWRTYAASVLFDRAVADRLRKADVHVGFSGQTLAAFRRARELRFERVELMAPTAHVAHVARLHAEAQARYPIEHGWLSDALVRRSLREYAEADVIHVASDYSRRSFLAEGIPAERLQRIELRVPSRFRPPRERPADGVFRIVYVGGLTVTKGVPVLLEAFARFPDLRAELTLVGGYGTIGMRRYLERTVRRDPRVRIAPGDPLAHLQRANACVHPSFHDGFGFGPMEALACGVPVVVSEDTGMKERVREGENGFVVPTGSVEAILERLFFLRESL